MKHPVRAIFERFGLVRKPGESDERYAEADRVVEEAMRETVDARERRRSLAHEANSFRPPKR